MARRVMNPNREAADVLNDHVVKLPSKSLCLCSYICAALDLGKRSLLLPWVVVNREIHKGWKC